MEENLSAKSIFLKIASQCKRNSFSLSLSLSLSEKKKKHNLSLSLYVYVFSLSSKGERAQQGEVIICARRFSYLFKKVFLLWGGESWIFEKKKSDTNAMLFRVSIFFQNFNQLSTASEDEPERELFIVDTQNCA